MNYRVVENNFELYRRATRSEFLSSGVIGHVSYIHYRLRRVVGGNITEYAHVQIDKLY